jgi:ABC-type sulfate transport system permease subunit
MVQLLRFITPAVAVAAVDMVVHQLLHLLMVLVVEVVEVLVQLNGQGVQIMIFMDNLDGKDPVVAAEAACIVVAMVVPVVVVFV